jgi:cytoskeletal protein CcmA (bactofilin family)
MRVSARACTVATLLALGFLAVGPCARDATAQDTVIVSRDVRRLRTTGIEQWAVDVFNAPGTLRTFGALTVDRDQRLDGDVAVLDGPVVVLGTITGDLVVINADVTIADGAVVERDVVVLGGRLEIAEGARVEGSTRRHSERVSVRRVGDRLELVGRSRPARRWRGFDDRDRGRAYVVLGLRPTYNRVEGLPLRLGAGIEWQAGATSGRIQGYGVFRTAGDFKSNREDIGYAVEGRIGFGTNAPRLTLGARGYDLVTPTQDWPLTPHEVGWATFLWHRDYRDYFLERGVAGFLTFTPATTVALTGEVARVEETSIAARDPWTPFRNAEAWRPNPLVDEGDFTLLRATAEYDSRPSDRSTRSGTLLRATWEHGIGDNVVEQPLPAAIRPALPASDYAFDRASVDLRRYQRIPGAGQLRLRGFWAGAVGGDPLPIQRRFSLGGPDPMNGYGFRAFACNEALTDPAMPGLCDHVLLFQAEYRGGFGLHWLGGDSYDRRDRPDRRPGEWWPEHGWDWDDWDWFDGPTLVLFTNAGTGWLKTSDGPDKLHWDVGAGLAFGSVGVYVARAIQEDEPIRVTLRIERRF